MQLPLACRLSAKSAESLLGVPLYVTYCFPLAAFNIFPFVFNFCRFGSLFWLGPHWLILIGDSLCFCTWMSVSFLRLGKFLAIMPSNMFSAPFLSLASFWGPYKVNVSILDVNSRSLLTCPHFFSSLFSVEHQWIPPQFQLADPFLCIIWSTAVSFSCIFQFGYCIPSSVWFFFIYSNSLLNFLLSSCIFLEFFEHLRLLPWAGSQADICTTSLSSSGIFPCSSV